MMLIEGIYFNKTQQVGSSGMQNPPLLIQHYSGPDNHYQLYWGIWGGQWKKLLQFSVKVFSSIHDSIRVQGEELPAL